MIRAEREPDLNAPYLPGIVLPLSTGCLRQSCWAAYSLPLLSISYILGNSPVWGRGESFAIFMMRLGNPFIKKKKNSYLSSVYFHYKQASKHFINIKLWVLSPILQMCKLRPDRLYHLMDGTQPSPKEAAFIPCSLTPGSVLLSSTRASFSFYLLCAGVSRKIGPRVIQVEICCCFVLTMRCLCGNCIWIVFSCFLHAFLCFLHVLQCWFTASIIMKSDWKTLKVPCSGACAPIS